MPAEMTPAAFIEALDKMRVEFEQMTAKLTAAPLTSAEEQTIRADERAKVAEEIATAILAVDPVEWALAGQRAGVDAAHLARQIGARRG